MITEQQEISEACYAKGQMRIEGGIIMNELGKPAKKGDIVLRHPETGYPLKRMGDEVAKDIDLRTGKVLA
jgi:hypothetical protein